MTLLCNAVYTLNSPERFQWCDAGICNAMGEYNISHFSLRVESTTAVKITILHVRLPRKSNITLVVAPRPTDSPECLTDSAEPVSRGLPKKQISVQRKIISLTKFQLAVTILISMTILEDVSNLKHSEKQNFEVSDRWVEEIHQLFDYILRFLQGR